MNPPTVNRRDLLRGTGLAVLGGVGLSACGSSFATGVAGTGAGKSNLSYWNLLGGGDGVRMVAMQDVYQKQNPNVDLNAVTLNWGNPYYTKVTLATLGDQPPDVAISHLTRMTILAQAGLLEPLDEDNIASYGFTANNFTPAAWKKAHMNGKLYAIPLDTHPWVMYYHTDVAKKAGLLDKHGDLKKMDSPEAFADALTAAKKVTGNLGGAISINGDFATQWRYFSTMYYQLGGKMLSDNGTRIIMDDDKAVKVLSFIRDLTKKGLMPTSMDYGGATNALATGQAGFYFEGDWEVSTFITAKTPFSMTAFPNIYGGRYAVQADSHSFVLPKDSKRTDAKRKVIFGFIKSMLDQSHTWAEGGHIPAWMPFQTSEAYNKIKPQSNYKWIANYARYDDPGWYAGSGSDFENITGSAIASVASGQTSPEAAVRDMRRRLTKYANTPSPV